MAYAVVADDTRREERRVTQEEREHAKNIPENYRKLLFDEEDAQKVTDHYTHPSYPTIHASSAATIERTVAPAPQAQPVYQPVHQQPAYQSAHQAQPVYQPASQPVVRPAHISEPVTPAQDYSSNTARRLADYVAYEPAKTGKRVLFDNITYKDYEIVEKPTASAAVAAPARPAAPAYAPVATPVYAPVAPAVPAYAPAEEDALPTQRTMDTLRHATARAGLVEEPGAGLLSMLSTRAKVVMCAIAAAVVLAIVLICVNTGILNAANAEISVKEAELQNLQQTYLQMQEEIDYLMSDEYIDSWAEQNGMVRGN